MTYREERILFEYKKKRIFQSPKNRIFPILLIKKCQFLLYLDLIKIRLEIILKDFAE